MRVGTPIKDLSIEKLIEFFNNRHDKLLCTANDRGEPDIALMGSIRILESGSIEFDVSDAVSLSYDNIKVNKSVLFMSYNPGPRARDYFGARIYAEVTQIETDGDKVYQRRADIRAVHGEEKAAEFQAVVTCAIKTVRSIVDRGQKWDEPPFAI